MYLGEAFDFSKTTALLGPSPFDTVAVAPSALTSPATTFVAATKPKSGFTTFIENLPNLFMGYTQVSLASKIAKINLERARQGLPPLDTGQVQAMAPRPGVAVGLSPDVKRIIIFGGVGIGALILFGMMGKKRRR